MNVDTLAVVDRTPNTRSYGSLNLSELDVILAMHSWLTVRHDLSEYPVRSLAKKLQENTNRVSSASVKALDRLKDTDPAYLLNKVIWFVLKLIQMDRGLWFEIEAVRPSSLNAYANEAEELFGIHRNKIMQIMNILEGDRAVARARGSKIVINIIVVPHFKKLEVQVSHLLMPRTKDFRDFWLKVRDTML